MLSEKTEQLKKAKGYALLLLKFRPRSISEFRDKLTGHGFSPDLTEELVDDFKRRGLLNDAKFASAWVEDRMSLNPMGKLKLKAELQSKGIDKTDIEYVFSKAAIELNEYEAAKKLAQKRLRSLARLNLDRLTVKRRLYGFLQRRGFSYDAVAKAVREATKNEGRHNSREIS